MCHHAWFYVALRMDVRAYVHARQAFYRLSHIFNPNLPSYGYDIFCLFFNQVTDVCLASSFFLAALNIYVFCVDACFHFSG